MPDEGKAVKLMRSPINTHCANEECKKDLPFGSWIYYCEETEDALCPECSVKRGWTPKDRVLLAIAKLELKEDIKALKQEKSVYADSLLMLKQQIDIYRLGEREVQLGAEISKLMKTVEDYLKTCGTTSEKEGFKKVFDAILACKDLQKEIREQIESHLFILRPKKRSEYQIPEENEK
jgi:hypothetical protein